MPLVDILVLFWLLVAPAQLNDAIVQRAHLAHHLLCDRAVAESDFPFLAELGVGVGGHAIDSQAGAHMKSLEGCTRREWWT